MPNRKSDLSKRRRIVKVSRKLVQVGFLFLFLYPFVPVIYRRLTYSSAPTFSSWLLPWDPLLLIGQAAHAEWLLMVIGAPLFLLSLSLIVGRSFCGWICPMGTTLDLVHSLTGWRRFHRRKLLSGRGWARRNNWLRYYLLLAILAGGFISSQTLGLFDPLVIFQRTATTLMNNIFATQETGLRIYFSVISLVFIGMAVLEFWQPRFWCRNLCPLGAIIGLVSRWSLLNRRVTSDCTNCGECLRMCPMRAIPREVHNTDYSDCTFCLECEGACPQEGISFGFGSLALKTWQKNATVLDLSTVQRRQGRYILPNKKNASPRLSRRRFIDGVAAGMAGAAIVPLIGLSSHTGVIRPPGALPEEEFLRTCILCQECVRVCPTGGLKPTFLESGLAGIGTPQLVSRQGACSIKPSCPDLCGKVCPTGALQPIRPEQLKIGLARVDHNLCLAWDQGTKCLVCVEACLNNAAQAYQGRVTIDPQKCTGCGRCESGCPVAGSAIHVYALETVS